MQPIGLLIYLNRPEKMTMTAGLSYFQGQCFADVRLLMADSLVCILPTLILFGLAQRYFVQGVVLTGKRIAARAPPWHEARIRGIVPPAAA